MKKLFLIILLFTLTLAGSSVMAQPPGGPGGGGGEDPPCWPPPCEVPIDGGLAFLLAAGLAYGGKKAFDVSKTEK